MVFFRRNVRNFIPLGKKAQSATAFLLPLFGRQKAAQKPTRGQKRLKDAV